MYQIIVYKFKYLIPSSQTPTSLLISKMVNMKALMEQIHKALNLCE